MRNLQWFIAAASMCLVATAQAQGAAASSRSTSPRNAPSSDNSQATRADRMGSGSMNAANSNRRTGDSGGNQASRFRSDLAECLKMQLEDRQTCTKEAYAARAEGLYR